MNLSERFITKLLLTALAVPLSAASGWLAAAAAKYGLHLSQGSVKSFGEIGIGAAVVLAVKLIHDVEVKHPKLVVDVKNVERTVLGAVGQAEAQQPEPAPAAVPGWPEG